MVTSNPLMNMNLHMLVMIDMLMPMIMDMQMLMNMHTLCMCLPPDTLGFTMPELSNPKLDDQGYPTNPELSEYEIILDDLSFKAQLVNRATFPCYPWAASLWI